LGHFWNRLVTEHSDADALDAAQLWPHIQAWARELGFARIGVSGIDLSYAESGLVQWLAAGFHGDMAYMAAHGAKRARPAELVPGTVSIITACMDYLPRNTAADWRAAEYARLARPEQGVVSLYARGRDYHKVVRQRLQALQRRIAQAIGPFGHRVFSDSAPVLEVELARRAALGWRGQHTLLIAPDAGSMFFLGELFVDFALPATEPAASAQAGHCGNCRACLDACPTGAIVAPGRVDARRCISYLTIEHGGPIPADLRPRIGNRIYGCDDCQLVCPWNKFARRSPLPDFDPRAGLTSTALTELFAWDEAAFLHRTEGSAIRRIGHARWLRNVAVALGNALAALPSGDARRAPLTAALAARSNHPDPLVREHVRWALAR
jgi:epoxyqueuosine reductase